MADLLIVIGVAKPRGLAQLNGVTGVCQSVVHWGNHSGFDVVPILDSSADVDAPAIQAALPATVLTARNRVIVYFCGHGFNVWGQVTWVLSPGADGHLGLLDVEAFKRALKTYGVRNISILGDACQTLAVPGLGATAILPPGPAPVWPPCLADTFYAAIPGQSALVLKDDIGRWRPVFSGVLSDALTDVPLPAGASDQQLSNAQELLVTSQSLGSYLEQEVESRSTARGFVQYAYTNSGLRWPNNVYRKLEIETEPDFLSGGGHNDTVYSDHVGEILSHCPVDDWEDDMDDWPGSQVEATEEPSPISDAKRNETYRAKTNSEWRIKFWESFLERARIVNNPGYIEVVTEARAMPAKVQLQPYSDSALLAIDDHLWSIVPCYHNAICGLYAVTVPGEKQHQRGVHAIGWHEAHQLPNEIKINPRSEWASIDDAMRVLKGFIDGTLNLSDIQATMENYRILKHINPIFGIVASYYYFSAGDIDSVVRTAGFYAKHSQPIPIDIALMTGADLVLRGGIVTVDLPAIPEAPHTRDAPSHLWCAAPDKPRSRVAGLLPIFRAGWNHLAHTSSDLSKLGALEQWLTNSPITAFDSPTGHHDFLEILATIGVGK